MLCNFSTAAVVDGLAQHLLDIFQTGVAQPFFFFFKKHLTFFGCEIIAQPHLFPNLLLQYFPPHF